MKIKLNITVEYDGNSIQSMDHEEFKRMLKQLSDQAASKGLFTYGTPAKVESWNAEVTVIPEKEDDDDEDHTKERVAVTAIESLRMMLEHSSLPETIESRLLNYLEANIDDIEEVLDLNIKVKVCNLCGWKVREDEDTQYEEINSCGSPKCDSDLTEIEV